jgi:hypothetical protein
VGVEEQHLIRFLEDSSIMLQAHPACGSRRAAVGHRTAAWVKKIPSLHGSCLTFAWRWPFPVWFLFKFISW